MEVLFVQDLIKADPLALYRLCGIFLAKAINGIKYMNGDYLDFKDLFMDIQMQKIRLSLQTLPTNIKE